MAKNKKEDRRSQRTRKLLHQALFMLMREKRYDSITVQDIIDRANIGRSTFYTHFVDKEDLAISSLEQILDALLQGPGLDDSLRQGVISTMGVFQHVQEQYPLFQTLVRGRGMELFLEKGQVYWSKKAEAHLQAFLPKGQEPAVPLPIVANYLAGSFVTLLKWWLDNKIPHSPERMDEIFQQLVMPGARAALSIKS